MTFTIMTRNINQQLQLMALRWSVKEEFGVRGLEAQVSALASLIAVDPVLAPAFPGLRTRGRRGQKHTGGGG